MTYRNENNDPDRTKTVRSPEEVKAMLLGSGPAADAKGDAPRSEDHQTTWVDCEGVRVVGMPYTRAIFQDEYGNPSRRCHTCGRAFNCACGDGCAYCVDGTPRQAEGEPERYAPASR